MPPRSSARSWRRATRWRRERYVTSLQRRLVCRSEAILFLIVLGIVAAVVVTTAAVHLGVAPDGGDQQVPANPFTLALNLISGDPAWHARDADCADVRAALLEAVRTHAETGGSSPTWSQLEDDLQCILEV